LRSQGTSLSQAEQRRKEQFDRSLQREVTAIERVISHKDHQPKRVGPLGTAAEINNYIESLRTKGEWQSLVTYSVQMAPSERHAETCTPSLSKDVSEDTLVSVNRSRSRQMGPSSSCASLPGVVNTEQKT